MHIGSITENRLTHSESNSNSDASRLHTSGTDNNNVCTRAKRVSV